MRLLNDHAVAGSTPWNDLGQVVCACIPLVSKLQILRCTGSKLLVRPLQAQGLTEMNGVPPLSPIWVKVPLLILLSKQGIEALILNMKTMFGIRGLVFYSDLERDIRRMAMILMLIQEMAYRMASVLFMI